MKLNQSQLVDETAAVVLSGGRRTTAENVRFLLGDVFDSIPNLVDGGFKFDAQVGYTSTISLTDNRSFTHKKYVDDLVATIDISGYLPKSAGPTQPLTNDLYFGNHYATNIVGLLDGSGIEYILGTRKLISTSTLPILSFDDITKGVGFITAAGVTSYIKPTSTTEETFLLPDKAGAGGTIAMLSDVTGSVTNVSGTTNRITVATGTTTPVIDISASYVGQSSITTLGTIVTGIWNGTAIADTYISSSSTWNAKQNALSGTGFVKISGTTISYDNSTYLTTISGIAAGGELSGTYANPTVLNSAVIGKVLTGYTSGAGTVAATDTILQAIQKLNGNIVAIVSSQWVTTGSDIYYSIGNVMIGNASAPLTKLHSVETSTATLRGALFGQYSTDTLSSKVTTRKARGSYGSPTTIVTADVLSNWTTSAYDGTNFLDAASIRTTSVGTIGTGRTPTKMELMTMTNVTTGVLTTALTLNETQKATFANTIEATTVSVFDSNDSTYKSGLVSGAATGQLTVGGTNSGYTRINMPGSLYLWDSSTTGYRQTISATNTALAFAQGWSTISCQPITTFTGSITGNTTSSIVFIAGGISPTSGSGIASGLAWTSTINQTGGTGMVVGFNATPGTITSITNAMAGFYSNMTATPTGGGVGYAQYHAGTGSHYFGDSNIIAGTTTGVKLLTATSQKLGIYGATPITQPTTAITASTFVANTSGTLNDSATWDGYTIGQLVKAFRNLGILA